MQACFGGAKVGKTYWLRQAQPKVQPSLRQAQLQRAIPGNLKENL
jgi:hypothetical protein